MNLKDAKEQVRLLGADERLFLDRLTALPPRRHITFARGFSQPAELYCEPFNPGPPLSKEEFQERHHATEQWIREHTSWSADAATFREPAVAKEAEEVIPAKAAPAYGPMLTDHWALLRCIETQPALALRDHFHALSWTDTRGYRIAKALREQGFIEDAGQQQTAGRYKSLVRLTAKGKDLYGRIARS